MKKQLVLGILAHVDSGKTTLSEGLLYHSGKIGSLGRVDHGNSYLDTDNIERERGITIFSKQAVFETDTALFTLLDTPGHIDFSAEAERTLQVLDYAILVISASEGVQSHTETLWRLLKQHNVPVFIFINKTDLPNAGRGEILSALKAKLSEGCIDFEDADSFCEETAMCGEELLAEYLETGKIADSAIAEAVANRQIFPCIFGSALRLEGVEEIIGLLDRYTLMPDYGDTFGAKVFKISQDGKGARLTHLKITGGSLKVKEVLDKEAGEKANEIRIYSGLKYQSEQQVAAGQVCAVTGLSKSVAGMGLGAEKDSQRLTLEPVFTYRVKILSNTDVHTALANLKRLQEEETQLNVLWNEQLKEINIRLMGEIQSEVLKRIVQERFDMEIELEKGGVVYKETIAKPVEGVGHYEPLRHYSEVHLLLEPLERGSGIRYALKCNEEQLDRSFQNLVLTHLKEKTHSGVLTGSPVTDIKITLVAGKAHLKHTEGGDFRQATYRAVRQGLMRAESVLLEPWYSFALELPTELVGRAMTDIDRMGGRISAPETGEETSLLKGSAPASKIGEYNSEVTAYTGGRGRLSLSVCGYEPCANQQQVIEEAGYDAEADTDNTADSVFCYQGAGTVVKWDKVFEHMHLPAMELDVPVIKQAEPVAVRKRQITFADDEELMRIFENTYGKVKRHQETEKRVIRNEAPPVRKAVRTKEKKGSYLLVDGYNIIFAWEELKKIAQEDLDLARTSLINRLCAYKAMTDTEVIAVFDAYKVKGNHGSCERVANINAVYTKEAETADSYIEKATHKLGRDYHIRVATSDYMEQLIILGGGAFRVTPSELLAEVESAEEELKKYFSTEILL